MKKSAGWGEAVWIENRTCVLGTHFFACVCVCTLGSWLDTEMLGKFVCTAVFFLKNKLVLSVTDLNFLFLFFNSFTTGFVAFFFCNMMHFWVKQVQSFNLMIAVRLGGKGERWYYLPLIVYVLSYWSLYGLTFALLFGFLNLIIV